jgi:hypothetical protein
MFGRNLIHETKAGRVTVGDAVELLSARIYVRERIVRDYALKL